MSQQSAAHGCNRGLVALLGRTYPQHPVFFATGAAAGAEPQPHPEPPVDFTSASRAQHASGPVGAGPPQQVLGAACVWVVDAWRSSASGVVVWVRVASTMSISCAWRRSHSSPLHFRRRSGLAADATQMAKDAANRLPRRNRRTMGICRWNRRTKRPRACGSLPHRAGGQRRPHSTAAASP